MNFNEKPQGYATKQFKLAAASKTDGESAIAGFKVLDASAGIGECIVSVFNNEDFGGDIVRRGFFARSIADQADLPAGVWCHDWTQPVALTLSARELAPGDPLLPAKVAQLGGLYIKAQYNLDTQRGREAFSDVSKGLIRQYSFGYLVTNENYDPQTGASELLDGEMFEWSPVLVGMNPLTSTISAKRRGAKGYQPRPYHQDPDELVVCPTCQRHNDDDANYCDQCGFDLTSTGFEPAPYNQGADELVMCPVCKRFNDDDASYCDQCGFQLAGADNVLVEKSRGGPATKAAIPVHHTSVDEGSWDGPANEKNLANDDGAEVYREAYAWVDPDKDPNTKAAYRFIHHDVNAAGKVGAANKSACSAGIAVLNGGRGGTTIPDADRKGVWEHLAAHLVDAGVAEADVPPLKSRDAGADKSLLTFAGEATAALAAAEAALFAAGGLSGRAKALAALRGKEGRVLSGANRSALTDIHGRLQDTVGAMTSALVDLSALLEATAGGSAEPTEPVDAGKSLAARSRLYWSNASAARSAA